MLTFQTNASLDEALKSSTSVNGNEIFQAYAIDWMLKSSTSANGIMLFQAHASLVGALKSPNLIVNGNEILFQAYASLDGTMKSVTSINGNKMFQAQASLVGALKSSTSM